MGYKMPIVCKEIYLPAYARGFSAREYKEETGIDLHDIFEYSEEDSIMRLKGFFKFYLVDADALSANGYYPVNAILPVTPEYRKGGVDTVVDTEIMFHIPSTGETVENRYGVRVYNDNVNGLSIGYWEL